MSYTRAWLWDRVRQQRLPGLLLLRDQRAAVSVGRGGEARSNVVAKKPDGGGVRPSVAPAGTATPSAWSGGR